MAFRSRFRRRRFTRRPVYRRRYRRTRRGTGYRRSIRSRYRPTSGLRRVRRVRAHVGPEWKSRVNQTISGISNVVNTFPAGSDPSLQARPVSIYVTRTPQIVHGTGVGQMVGRRLSSCRWQIRFQISAGIYDSVLPDQDHQYPKDTTYTVRMIVYQVKNANGTYSPNETNYHEYAVPTGLLGGGDSTRIMNTLFRIDDDLILTPDANVYAVGAPNLYRFRSGTMDDVQILYDKTKTFYSGGRNAWVSRMKFKINPLQFETRIEADGDAIETYFDNHVYAMWLVQPVRVPHNTNESVVEDPRSYWITQSVIQDTLLYKDD